MGQEFGCFVFGAWFGLCLLALFVYGCFILKEIIKCVVRDEMKKGE